MSERTVSVRLRAVTDQFERAMRGAAGSLNAVQSNADGLVRTGKSLSKYVTAPLVGLGAAVTYMGSQFESSMSGVSAVTQATEGELASMSDTAQELGRTTQFSASQAAEALEFLGMAGFSATEATEALPDVLNLAAAGGMDLARSADLASNVLGQFGLEVDQTARVADVLAETARNSNTSVEQLGQGLQMAGPVANAAGLEIEETAAAMGLMGDAGIQASQAGTSLRGAMTRLLNASGPAAETLARLGVNAEMADGTLRPLPDILDQLSDSGATAGDLMEIFGQRAGPAMAALIEQGGDALRDLTDTLNDSTGAAAEQAAERMDNLSGDLQRLRSAAEGAGIAFYEAGIGDVLRGLAQTGADALQAVSELPDPLVRTGVAIGGVAAAAGPAITAVGVLAQQAPKIVSTFSTGLDTMRGFGRFLTGPWGLAMAGATAAIGVFIAEKGRQAQAISEVIATLDEETGAITTNTQEWMARELQSRDAGDSARELGLSLGEVQAAAMGEADALERVNAAIEEGLHGVGPARDAARDLSSIMIDYGGVVADAESEQRELNDAVAESEGIFATSGSRLDNHSDRQSRNTTLTEDNAEAQRDLAGAMEEVTDQADTLTDALDTLAGRQMDVNEASRNWEEALDDLSESIGENGDTLDVNTSKGRDNQRSLEDGITAAFDHGQAMLDNGASVEEATDATLDHIAELRQQAIDAGLSASAVDDYIETLGLTPEEVRTQIALDSDQAMLDINDFRGNLSALPSSVTIPIRVTRPGESVGQVHSDLARRGGAGSRVNHLGGPAGQGPIRYHSGGLAADEIPAILQRGEFVINRDATARNHALLDAINTGRMHSGGAAGPSWPASASPQSGGRQESTVQNIYIESQGDVRDDAHAARVALLR